MMRPRVTHMRACVNDQGEEYYATWQTARDNNLTIKGNGGITEVQLVDDNGNILSEANAFCSDKEGFNKGLGRLIATSRARFLLERPDEHARRVARREEQAAEKERQAARHSST